MLELTVKTLDSQNHSFTVPDETTVRQLKENILEKMEIPIEIQRLIFHGKVLQDEKKLTDYGDVNGKVIHLVQRPPPPARSSNVSSSDSNLRSNIRRSLFGHRDRLEGSNTTYLGAMAFPTDLMEAQGMMHPPPSQGLSRTRLFVAKRMLNRAASSIWSLENDGQAPSGDNDNQENMDNFNLPRTAPSAPAEEGREDPEVLLGTATGSIAQAAQAATAAAIAAAVSAAQAAGVPHITIRGATGQSSSVPTTETANSNLDDVNILILDENHPEDVAAEVEIGANNDTNMQDRQEPSTNANNMDNNASAPNANNAPRRTVERTIAFANLLSQLEEYQRRFQPLLRRCHQLMVEDPSFNENSSPNAEECQRLFNGVSETMHHFAHAYHALSDIMVDFNEDTPRALRCRPVIIQHTAILETGFPIQAPINLSARRTLNGSGSNLSASDSSHQNADGHSSTQSQAETNASAPSTAGSGNTNNSQTAQENENVTAQASASSFASAGSQQSEERSTTSQPGSGNNTSGFFLSGPGNVEIYMDFGPQGVALGSVEAAIVRGSDARNTRHNLGTGIQLGNLGPVRPPIEVFQSMQAVADQIQNHILGRVNQASQADQPPPPYEANFQSGATLNEGNSSNHSVSTQARSTPSTESTNATPIIPTPRHQIHMGRINPGIALSSYDPFLPCNSHHVRSPQRSQNSNSQGTARAPSAASNTNASAASNSNPASSTERERPNNAQAEGGIPSLTESYMAIMSHFLNPQRFNLNRNQGRQGATGGDSLFDPPPEWVVRRFYPQSQADMGTSQGNIIIAPLPNSILGWRLPTPGQNDSGTRQSAGDSFRASGAAGSDGNQVQLGSSIFDFLSTISDTSYVEGESIVADFFVTLATNLTWQDIIELSSMTRTTMVESLMARLQPVLQNFVTLRLLQGETPTREVIARGCERLYVEMRPYIELMQEVRLRDSIDLVATINNFNRSQLPEIISLIVDPEQNQPEVFGQNVTSRIRNYMRQLIAIIIHCCQDGNQGFDSIIQNCVRLLTRGVPEELQQWTELNSVNILRSYTTNLDVPLEDIQRYVEYRTGGSTAEREQPTEPVTEPMETDAPPADGIWNASAGISSTDKADDNINDGLVGVDNENLPDVLIGSETWHNALPSEWVPIITRDTQRQRRQSSQKPFSDAYLSSLPAKRRKLIASSKPQGNLSQVISDGVRQAINAAGISSPVAEKVIAEAGKDDVLQAAYKEQERVCVSADLKRNPDFSPSRFPNAFKYFDK
ncbi:UNVERIFIED_CONTAM: hypothetical protein PYX00_001471 [Menopon gallinae]|uniref:Large proline-rich protein BAG6 n=1 Tax=Menopon gallinae TaxID=328185 RepID=A0AAW2IE82_9NEOP